MTRADKETVLLKHISDLRSALQKLKLKLDLIAKWLHYNCDGLPFPPDIKDAALYADLDLSNLLNTSTYLDNPNDANDENSALSVREEFILDIKEEVPLDDDIENGVKGLSPPYSLAEDHLHSYGESEISKNNLATDEATKAIPKTKTLVVLLEDINKVGKPLRKNARTRRLRRQRKIFKPKRYKCTTCDRGFGKEIFLRNHQKSAHNENQPYQCHHEGCEKCFSDRQALLRHLRGCHRDNYFEMDVKRQSIINKIHCGRRIAKVYQCSFEGCEKFFWEKETLKKHQEDENHLAESSEAVEGSKKHICQSCHNLFSTCEELKEHISNGCFSCAECNQVYGIKSDLLRHLETHGNKFICDYDGCNKVFMSTYHLHMHSIRHFAPETENNPNEAEITSRIIVTSENNENNNQTRVQQHKNQNDCSEIGTFVCHLCKLTFTDRAALNIHIFHFCYKCKICRKTFPSDTELINHDKHGQCHKLLKSKDYFEKVIKRKKPKRSGKLSCEVCEIGFGVDKDFEEHMKQHEVQLFYCRHVGCKRRFVTESKAEEHEKAIHCQKCCKPFGNMARFTAHNNTKHNGQSASLSLAADVIQTKASSTSVFVCQKCKIFFDNVNQLRIHTKVGCSICNICGLVCRRNVYLQSHIATTHKRERSFLCSECGKSYVSKQVLAKHSIVHTSMKDRQTFECLTCAKVFFSVNGYSRHMKTHEAGGRIQCPKCGFDFANEQTLKYHIAAVHENQRPYPCHLCEKKFKARTHLTTHMKTHDNPNGRKRGLNKDIDEFAAAAKRRNLPK